MDTGKVLDVEALSQGCKQCERHEHLDKTSLEYQTWKTDHTKCKANFQGSAPAMEPEGTDRIFRRSVELHNLRYNEFYGDGDSKSYSRVKDVYQDAGIEIEKKECIGHVQKRVGTALRKLKRDKPGLGGKGKLTDSQIYKLQNYYGIAIRSNVGNLAGMKKAIHASLMHCASSEARPLHDYCPTGSASWCRYQQDKANRTKLYKHGPGLPLAVIKEVKPEYVRLSEDRYTNLSLRLNVLYLRKAPSSLQHHETSLLKTLSLRLKPPFPASPMTRRTPYEPLRLLYSIELEFHHIKISRKLNKKL